MYNFNALVSRIKYIPRWSLMRQSRQEYLAEHTTEVMQIAHTLAAVAKEKFGADVDEKNIVLCGLYHDISEILTGDMPTPVKYYNPIIRDAYKVVEGIAADELLKGMPKEMREVYYTILHEDKAEEEMWHFVKAADKISAYIKCVEEQRMGNCDFEKAGNSILEIINELNMPEVDYFMKNFMPAYLLTLDESR